MQNAKQKTLFQTWKEPKNEGQELVMLTEEFQEEFVECSEELDGFDESSGNSWIYPINYPVRDYQFNIVKASLYKNTLVTLPTGLGKTFIAAVVMYNFYRWYPSGKIVFMAPTKPLVAQQIEACYNIMGIPQKDTNEMTGSIPPNDRKSLWISKRVFFLTPQVMANDLTRNICPSDSVKCIIIDEAHKALGNHSYCQVVKELQAKFCKFRVLALSATPGSDIKSVQQVIDNLNIGHIEIRSEESIDIQPYTHGREIEKIVVKPGDTLTSLMDTYLSIISYYVNKLVSRGAMPKRDPKTLSKFMLLKYREGFRQDPPMNLQRAQMGSVEGDFALCLSLFHAYELLQLHGSRSFYNFLKGMIDGSKGQMRAANELKRNDIFLDMMMDLDELYQEESFNQSLLNNSMMVREKKGSKFVMSHPKLGHLQEILKKYFEDCKYESIDSRVMVFSQYRESVLEITEMLNINSPLIKAMSFIGQKSKGGSKGRGFTQKEQIKVIRDFKNGGYNTLVSTCVGEEGLDIGEVDLIVCYDAPTSPLRLVQRMGRTGRKRKGRIIVLTTEGKEEQMYNQSVYNKKSIHKALMNGKKLKVNKENNHRMVPKQLNPSCIKLHMTMKLYEYASTSKKENDVKVRNVKNLEIGGKGKRKTAFLNNEQLKTWSKKYKEDTIFFYPPKPELICLEKDSTEDSKSWLSDWLIWQENLQPHDAISHSGKTKCFVEALKFINFQLNLDDKEDNYGMEMALYLDKDDICEDVDRNKTTGLKEISDPPQDICHNSNTEETCSKKVANSAVMHTDDANVLNDDSMDELPDFDFLDTLKKDDKNNTASNKDDISEITSSSLPIKLAPSCDEIHLKDCDQLSPINIDAFLNDMESKYDFGLYEFLKSCETKLVSFNKENFESCLDYDVRKHSEFSKEPFLENIVTDNDFHNDIFDDEIDDSLFKCFNQSFDSTFENLKSKKSGKLSPVKSSGNVSDASLVSHEKPKLPESKRNNTLNSSDLYTMTQLIELANQETQLNDSCFSINDDFVPPSPEVESKLSKLKSSQRLGINKSNTLNISKSITQAKSFRKKLLTKFNAKDNCDNIIEQINEKLFETDPFENCQLNEQIAPNDNAKDSHLFKEPKLLPNTKISSKSTCRSNKSDVADITLEHTKNDIFEIDEEVAKCFDNEFEESFAPIIDFNTPKAKYEKVVKVDSPIENSKGLHSSLINHRHSTPKIKGSHSNVSINSTKKSLENLSFDDGFEKYDLRETSACDETNTSDNSVILGKKRRINFLDISSPEVQLEISKPKKKKAKMASDARNFLDEEAILSGDESLSEDEIGNSQLDEFDASFINDAPQSQITRGDDQLRDEENVDPMAMYLQSVKSPERPGRYKLQFNPSNEIDVFSQLPEDNDDSYENDSFCVDNDHVEYCDSTSSVDDFEEQKIEKRKPKAAVKGKRKRIIRFMNSSSDEEKTSSRNTIATVACQSTTLDVTDDFKNSRILQTSKRELKYEKPTYKKSIESNASTSLSGNDESYWNKSKTTFNESQTTLDQKLIVFADTKEICSSQKLLFELRKQNDVEVHVQSLKGCNYILSNRVAVFRKSLADFANGSNKTVILDSVRKMCELFDRPYIIIEKFSKKSESKSTCQMTKYFSSSLAYLSQTHIKFLSSYSPMDSCFFLHTIARQEARKGMNITVNVKLNVYEQQLCKLYCSLPRVSYIAALILINKFSSFKEFSESSVGILKTKGGLSQSRAEEIHKFLHKNFNVSMLPC